MKSKTTPGLVLAIILVLLMTGAAIAMGGNLFAFFGQGENPALEYVADHVATPAPSVQNVSVEQPVVIDSTYFDGTSLLVSYRIPGGIPSEEPYTPTDAELQSMEPVVNPMPTVVPEGMVPVSGGKAAGAYGTHTRSLSRRDHIRTTDGVDIPWNTDQFATQGEDQVVYVQFDAPLPEAIAAADAFTLVLRFYPQDTYTWFDGETLYRKIVTGEEFTVAADVAKNDAAQALNLSGKLTFNGAAATIDAVVTPVVVSMRYPALEGVEFLVAYDTATGEELDSTGVNPQQDGTILQTFAGLGRMSESLTVCPATIFYNGEDGKETKELHYYTEQSVALEPLK